MYRWVDHIIQSNKKVNHLLYWVTFCDGLDLEKLHHTLYKTDRSCERTTNCIGYGGNYLLFKRLVICSAASFFTTIHRKYCYVDDEEEEKEEETITLKLWFSKLGKLFIHSGLFNITVSITATCFDLEYFSDLM